VSPDVDYPSRPLLEFVEDPAAARDPAALRDFLQRFGPAPPHDPTPAELDRIAALREAAEHVLDVVASGRLPQPDELRELNEFLATPVEVQVTAGEAGLALRTTPLSAGWDTVVRELAGRLAALLVHGEPGRIKRCANPDCRRLFYDLSRNRTRRWHDDACGNLTRVRRFRASR
jgi:predicted RNA-binding Zn ribbon-like protein